MHVKINTLEAGRGFAALAVVLFHMNAAASFKSLPTSPWLGTLLHGVDFFFVISGFIIFYVHRDDIGHFERARAFAIKRFIRLYPTLWLIAPAWIVAWLLMHRETSIAAIVSTLLLSPSVTIPVPDSVWTLRHELLFYISFMMLILNRRVGIGLYLVWTMAVFVQLGLVALGSPLTGVGAFFTSAYEIDFLLGALVAMMASSIRPSAWPIIFGLTLVLAVLAVGQKFNLYRSNIVDYTTISGTWWVVALGLCFSVLLYGTLAIDSLVRVPRWLVLLGESSYALYLVHVPVQYAIAKLAGHAPDWLVLSLLVVVPVGVAVGLHRWVERPISKYLRHAWLPRRVDALTA